MKSLQAILIFAVALAVSACATVRKQDLDAWVGVPVEALDTHSFFLTVPMVRTASASGIEIRNYSNGADFSECSGSGNANRAGGFINAMAFSTCTSGRIVCNNIFYIKDGVVIEYAPTGSCYTDATVQPQPRYLRLQKH